MHEVQTPSPGEDTGLPCRGDRPPRGRRRGQPALRKLRTTDDFGSARLTLAQRKLILFVAVVMADEDGCLSATYGALLAAHAHDPEHWTHDHTLKSLQKRASRYVGRGAEHLPGWDKVVDVLRVVIPEPHFTAVLAEAAGLYSRAIDADKPAPDYSGEIRLPVWADAPAVSIEDIRTGLWSIITPVRSSVSAPQPVEARPADPLLAERDPQDRELFENVIRAFRETEQLLEAAQAENTSLRKENKTLRAEKQRLSSHNRLLQNLLDARSPDEPQRILQREKNQLILTRVFPPPPWQRNK
ncbi:hypothetical protein [Amycolatopsis pigmentata]|uniref:Transposase n=1 Tax=Amycolatopsis pigmentata TaxID=450801 RepID=A0ABW5FJM0_9PSEU